MRVFAVDPGSSQSGWVLLEEGRLIDSGVHSNDDVLYWIQTRQGAHKLIVEDMVSMGMPAGQEVLDTAKWLGRYIERWTSTWGSSYGPPILVPRRDVKSFLCGTQRAKDPNIRQALLDIFPATGGGSTPQVGTKARPGPLHGISSHAWSALAVAVTACARLRIKGVLPDMPQREIEEFA